MECHLAYAIVLDQKGRFKKVANLHYEVGQKVSQVVEFAAVRYKSSRKISALFSNIISTLISAICFWQFLFVPVGAVTMQINPTIKAKINRLNYIISIEGLNEDGKALLDNSHYQFKAEIGRAHV